MRILWKLLNKNVTRILDVGCGKSSKIANKIKEELSNVYLIGIDLFLPYLKECKEYALYDEIILADAEYLPFKRKSFDITLCLEVIEHLQKRNAIKLFKTLEMLSNKQLIFSTLVGFMPQEEYDGNIWQIHKSIWYPKDFKKHDYEVKGVSGPFFLSAREHYSGLSKILFSLAHFVMALFQPLYYIAPKIAFQMICSKNLTLNL